MLGHTGSWWWCRDRWASRMEGAAKVPQILVDWTK